MSILITTRGAESRCIETDTFSVLKAALGPNIIKCSIFYLIKIALMEPILTPDGYKVLQNPEESRSLLRDYYERQGFQVVEGPGEAARSENSLATPVAGESAASR